jgi:hypothetical protein
MVIPQSFPPKDAAAAIERLLSTEDGDGVRYHEKIIRCMPRAEAEQWQRRLFSSDGARLVDRPLGAGRSCIRLNLHNSFLPFFPYYSNGCGATDVHFLYDKVNKINAKSTQN